MNLTSSEPAASELTIMEHLRVEYKQTMPKLSEHKGRTKKTGTDGKLGAEMDTLINADSKHRNIGCYRIPIMAYFENDRTGSFSLC